MKKEMSVERIIIEGDNVKLLSENKEKNLDLSRIVLSIEGNANIDIVKGNINIKPKNGIIKCEDKGGDYWTQIYHCRIQPSGWDWFINMRPEEARERGFIERG